MNFEQTQAACDAEAAAWLARLHSSRKTGRTEAAFRTWLGESEDHREAFERATEIWDLLPSAAPGWTGRDAREKSRWRAYAMAASLAALLAAGSTWLVTRDPVYETGVGEQQLVVLDDHSRIALNTNSELEVHYSGDERRVVLDRGEALFEVSKDPARPFVVVSGAQTVRAIGTRFIVRQENGETRVTLLEGRVQVTGPSAPRLMPLATLDPGERVIIKATAGAALDRPSLEAATAWRRGEVVFEDASLIEAASELNRYNEAHLVISDPALASKRLSGVFATDDVAEVAKAIATLHGLQVERDGRDFKLRAAGQENDRAVRS